jgi:hypothetical protein
MISIKYTFIRREGYLSREGLMHNMGIPYTKLNALFFFLVSALTFLFTVVNPTMLSYFSVLIVYLPGHTLFVLSTD